MGNRHSRREKYRERPKLSIDARTAAKILGGEARGNHALVPGPGHTRADRSLSVLFSWDAPEGFVVKSHAGDDPLVCRDYVKAALGLRGDLIPAALLAPPVARPEPSDAERTAYALSYWFAAKNIPGTPAERYLRRRGVWEVMPEGALGEALRWHPNGMMVALVRDIRTDAPKAIHRTYLDRDGNKADRKCLGPIGGGAVKLTDGPDVTLGLGVGEGIETVLSLRQLPDLGRLAVWSLISANQVEAFPVLAGIEGLWIAVDHDPAGIRASEAVAERWTAAGRDVFTIAPTTAGADLNDIGGGVHAA